MTSAPQACASCGARNPATAEWCSQCYAPTGASPVPDGSAVPEEAPVVGERVVPDDATERFRVVDGDVQWCCPVCGAWTPVDERSCSVCATPLEDGSPTTRTADVSPSRVRRAGLLLPAGGQWVLGQRGVALARMLTVAAWLVGAAGILAAGGVSTATLVPVAILVAGVGALWGLSLVDATDAAAGRSRELLGGRTFLWLVIAVLGAVMVSMALLAVSSRAS